MEACSLKSSKMRRAGSQEVLGIAWWNWCSGRGHVLVPAGIRTITRRFSMTASVGIYIVPVGMKNLEDYCIQRGGISQDTEEQRERKSEP